MPSGPPQRWVISAPSTAGNRSTSALQRGRRRLLVEVRADARAEVVRRTPAAEDEPVVGGALAVHDHVPVLAERLPRQPGGAQKSCGSGSVAMISE